jgi:hypothetical protein
VQAVLLRDRAAAGYDLAPVTTDTAASPAQVIERYAARWSIEVAIEDAKQVFGAGQARNRTANAVRRTALSSSPAKPSPRAGTPPPVTTPPTSMVTAPGPPGSRRKSSRPPPTSPASSAAS